MEEHNDVNVAAEAAARPEGRLAANSKKLVLLSVFFHWLAWAAAGYALLIVAANWMRFYGADAQPMDLRVGVFSTVYYVVLGAVLWAIFTGASAALERLLMLGCAREPEGK